jgi:hypothetical protein
MKNPGWCQNDFNVQGHPRPRPGHLGGAGYHAKLAADAGCFGHCCHGPGGSQVWYKGNIRLSPQRGGVGTIEATADR